MGNEITVGNLACLFPISLILYRLHIIFTSLRGSPKLNQPALNISATHGMHRQPSTPPHYAHLVAHETDALDVVIDTTCFDRWHACVSYRQKPQTR